MDRRHFVKFIFSSALLFKDSLNLAYAETVDRPLTRNLLIHEKTIRLNDAAWRLALSPDGKSFAFVGFQSGKVFVVDIASGQATEIEVPDIRPKTMIVWSNDGKKLAVSGVGVLAVASVEQRKTLYEFDVQKMDRPPQSAFGEAAIFSPDDTKIYIQNRNGQSQHLILILDLSAGTITSFMQAPNPKSEILNIQRGEFQYSVRGGIFSTAIGYSDGIKTNFRLNFAFQCVVLPLQEGLEITNPIPFIADVDHGIDDSGVMRQFFEKALFSQPAKLTVIFRESGTVLPNVNVDFSKDKAFEAFDAHAHRVSTFGGYGVLEGNFINDFDVHSIQPWVVTTASQVKTIQGRTVGMVTVWDISTGQPLQRIEAALGMSKPIISRDGRLMIASASDGINIFHFS